MGGIDVGAGYAARVGFIGSAFFAVFGGHEGAMGGLQTAGADRQAKSHVSCATDLSRGK